VAVLLNSQAAVGLAKLLVDIDALHVGFWVHVLQLQLLLPRNERWVFQEVDLVDEAVGAVVYLCQIVA